MSLLSDFGGCVHS